MILGCANQAGEDNRNLARMAGLLAGLPDSSGGVTLNRLCGSGLDAVAMAARAIRGGESDLIIAGGSRKHEPRAVRHGQGDQRFRPQRRDVRHHHRLALRQSEDEGGLRRRHHAEHRRECRAGLPGQPRGPGRLRAAQPGEGCRAQANGRLAAEIVAVEIPQRKGDPVRRRPATSIRARRRSKRSASCKPIVRPDGTVTAGNASGVNDGAAAIIIASEEAAKRNGLTPQRARARRSRRRRAAAHHGHRPGAREREADEAARPQDRRLRRDRAERGLRRPRASPFSASSDFPTMRHT